MKRTRGAGTNGRGDANAYERMVMLLMTAAIATLGAVLALLSPHTTWAQTAPQTAYTTSHPGRNPPWLGLASPSGRYEILLGDGCERIGPDMNVLLERSDETNEAAWTLQLAEGADQVCNVAEWHWQGNTPCAQNPDSGDCDVEHS